MPEQQQLIAKMSACDAEQINHWTYQQWTPGKRLVGLYLGSLASGRYETLWCHGLIAGDGALLFFETVHFEIMNRNLTDQLKAVPIGAGVEITCDLQRLNGKLVFDVYCPHLKKQRLKESS